LFDAHVGISGNILCSLGKGYRTLFLESDSAIAVSLVNKGCSSTHPCFSIVFLINRLMMKDWQVIVSHIYSQANQVADRLVDYALSIPTSTYYLDHPLPDCVNLL